MAATMTWEERETPAEAVGPGRLKPALRTSAHGGAPIYHVADEGVISTRHLVEVLAQGMGVKPRLLSVPRWMAMTGATLLGRQAVARRLFDDLEVDASAFTRDTGWPPKKPLDDGLREMAADHARNHGLIV